MALSLPLCCGVIAILDTHHPHRCYFLWDEKPVRKLPAGWWRRGPVLCRHTPPSPWFHHSSVRGWTGSLHSEILSVAPISHGAVGQNWVAQQQQHCRTKHSPPYSFEWCHCTHTAKTFTKRGTRLNLIILQCNTLVKEIHEYTSMEKWLCTSSPSTKNKGVVNIVTLESSKILLCNIMTWCLVSCHLWTYRSIAHTGTLRLYFIMSPLPKAPRTRPCPLFLHEWLFFSLKGQFTPNRGALSLLRVFWGRTPTLNLKENSSWKD